MIETVLSGLLGGALRVAPEILKFFDRKNERSHELSMLDREVDLAKSRAEAEIRAGETKMSIAELDAMGIALREQGETAQSGGWFVSALSALVRPVVTYWFVGAYSAVKAVSMSMAVNGGAQWSEVLTKSWTSDDMSILTMVLTFWFVGRVYERQRSNS